MCRYGRTGVCQSLPVDGVSDRDYENHIMRDHVEQEIGKGLGVNSYGQV